MKNEANKDRKKHHKAMSPAKLRSYVSINKYLDKVSCSPELTGSIAKGIVPTNVTDEAKAAAARWARDETKVRNKVANAS